jgi:hypothetical protein
MKIKLQTPHKAISEREMYVIKISDDDLSFFYLITMIYFSITPSFFIPKDILKTLRNLEKEVKKI